MTMTRSSNEPAERGNRRASIELQLKRDAEAPSVARAAVMGGCEDCELSASVCHTLVLLVSELVSNAVLHSRAAADAPITLTASVTAEAVCVAVTDAGGGFTPVPRKPDAAHGGYGLYLLEKAASRWGVDRTGGTRVWFELPRTVKLPRTA
jgi:anti-sigma regulatory factor (Ser/Thr protein kinase)